jgi:hypothetical protein
MKIRSLSGSCGNPQLVVDVPTLKESSVREVYPGPNDTQQLGLEINGEFYWFPIDQELREELMFRYSGGPASLMLVVEPATNKLAIQLRKGWEECEVDKSAGGC